MSHELSTKNWLVWKQMEDFMKEFIGGIEIWYEYGCRFRCKGLEMIHTSYPPLNSNGKKVKIINWVSRLWIVGRI